MPILSSEHLHETACGLQEGEHYVRDDLIDVIEHVERVVEKRGLTFDWGAAGCGSCFHTDADAAVFWVAQGDGTKDVALNFDSTSDELSREELGDIILNCSDAQGVPASWNGDTSKCVIVGVNGAYRNFDVGTRVRKETRRSEKTGTVLSVDLIHDDNYEWLVMEGDKWHGTSVAMFEDEDDAERFARNAPGEHNTRRRNFRGRSDGDNIVLWDGHSKPTLESAKGLEEIDEDA